VFLETSDNNGERDAKDLTHIVAIETYINKFEKNKK